MKKLIILITSSLIVLSGCKGINDENDDKTKSIDKDGSIEVTLSIDTLKNGTQIFRVVKNSWVLGELYKTTVSSDTIPNLGDTVEIGETSNGDDTSLLVPKHYQIFVTVK